MGTHQQMMLCLLVASCMGVRLVHGAVTSDLVFYETAPAPAPGSCPYGSSNATLDLEVTEGPYYVEEDLFRSNVTESQGGLPLQVRITVLDTDCNPVVGALVDIWHCNATGVYSSYTGLSPGGNLAPAASRKMLSEATTDNSTFLRGTVETDANGVAVFSTVVPGWYSGRVTHIHTKVHIVDELESSLSLEYAESHVAHTGQFFFEEELLDRVFALYPYSRHTGDRTALEDDMVFASSGSDTTLLFDINQVDPANLAVGLVGSVTAIIDPLANNTDSSMTGMGMGGSGMGPMSESVGMSNGLSGGMQGGVSLPGSSNMPPMMQPGALPTLTGRRLASHKNREN